MTKGESARVTDGDKGSPPSPGRGGSLVGSALGGVSHPVMTREPLHQNRWQCSYALILSVSLKILRPRSGIHNIYSSGFTYRAEAEFSDMPIAATAQNTSYVSPGNSLADERSSSLISPIGGGTSYSLIALAL